MKSAFFRFYEELNDFLGKSRRKVLFQYCFSGNPTIKDVIQMIGVPHSEVDLILVNSEPVDFDYRLCQGDHVSVYPTFEAIEIAPINHLRPKPLRDIKFILDVHLGRLAKHLRICGFDCWYQELEDKEIILLAAQQKRIILTKDRGLLKDKNVTHGYWVRAQDPHQQLLEVFERFDLGNKIQFLVRCLVCNSKLKKIDKREAQENVPSCTTQHYEDYFFCAHCHKIYWKGSHYKNMAKLVKFVTKSLNEKKARGNYDV